jgi:hypothetical protein
MAPNAGWRNRVSIDMGGDLQNPRLMYLKAALFVALGATASICLLLEAPSLRVAALLAVAIWAFARAYYFAFYVIEHYIDPGFCYAGLWSFVRYWARRPVPTGSRLSENKARTTIADRSEERLNRR